MLMADSDPEEFFECTEDDKKHNRVACSDHANYNHVTAASTSVPSGSNGVDNTRIRPNKSERDNQELSVWGGRTVLPCQMFSRNDFSVWSILKNCIGKELSKITMPVIFNEPLSFLQRVVEYMEYLDLLKRASDSNDPIERHELITAFAVSAAASNWDRIGKPFNPLLGETYELDREDLGFRIVCEQVSHHPPVSAFHMDSPLYSFHGSIYPKLKFWGKSVEVTPKGLVTLYLKRHDEAYSWQNVNCCVHNIIVGKLWIEHYGAMEVTNHKNNYKSVLNFLPCGWFGKDIHKVEGFLFDSHKRKLKAFYGKWVDAMFSYDVEVWDEYLRLVGTHPPTSNKSTASLNRNQSLTMDTSSPAATNGSVSSSTLSSSKQSSLTKTVSTPMMSSLSARSSNDVPDDIPVRGSTCDLNLPTQKLLWASEPKPANCSLYYGFTSFALLLNELNAGLLSRLPPTDCRLRPDIRRMEDGLMDAAGEEKKRIEEKQRVSQKERKRRKDDQTALWFKFGVNPYTGKDDWLFNGDYWKRNWSRCPDIF